MDELPAPLVPAEVDLQDFAFMPLHVARLRDSDLAAEENPEACWYAVLLWAASWHQIPAGSLPDNDTVLMRLVGLGRDTRTWKKHREGALRGFVLCSDGRLYHPVVAETVLDSWNSKLRQRHTTFCAAVRQHNKRNPEEILQSPSFDEWDTLGRPKNVTDTVTDLSRVTGVGVTRDSGSKRREERDKGQGYNIEEPNGSLSADADDDEDQDRNLFGEKPSNGSAPEPAPPEFKPEHVVEAWNKLAAECGLPPIVKLSDQRRRQLKARMREHSLDDFVTAIDAIRRSPFLREGNGKWRGANFDFFLQPSSFLKLIEGHYEQPAN